MAVVSCLQAASKPGHQPHKVFQGCKAARTLGPFHLCQTHRMSHGSVKAHHGHFSATPPAGSPAAWYQPLCLWCVLWLWRGGRRQGDWGVGVACNLSMLPQYSGAGRRGSDTSTSALPPQYLGRRTRRRRVGGQDTSASAVLPCYLAVHAHAGAHPQAGGGEQAGRSAEGLG